MNISDIMEYILKTPGNTNPRILKTMLQEISNEGGSSEEKTFVLNDVSDLPEGNEGDLYLVLKNITNNVVEGNTSSKTVEGGYVDLGAPTYTVDSVNDYFTTLLTELKAAPDYVQASGNYDPSNDDNHYFSYDSQTQTYTEITYTLHENDSLEYYYTNNSSKECRIFNDDGGLISEIRLGPVGEQASLDLQEAGCIFNSDSRIDSLLPTTYKYYFQCAIGEDVQQELTQIIEHDEETITKTPVYIFYFFETIIIEENIEFSPGWNVFYATINQNTDEESYEIIPFTSLTEIFSIDVLTEDEYTFKYHIPSENCVPIFEGLLRNIIEEEGGLYLNTSSNWEEVTVSEAIEYFSPVEESDSEDELTDPISPDPAIPLPPSPSAPLLSPTWNWSNDYTSATATFEVDGQEVVVEATVTEETDKDGVIYYAATVIYDGNTYTSSHDKD